MQYLRDLAAETGGHPSLIEVEQSLVDWARCACGP
jgi:hypothetical protein